VSKLFNFINTEFDYLLSDHFDVTASGLCAADVGIINCVRKKKLSCQKREPERNGCIKLNEKGRIQ
jgi:hypothetical protein